MIRRYATEFHNCCRHVLAVFVVSSACFWIIKRRECSEDGIEFALRFGGFHIGHNSLNACVKNVITSCVRRHTNICVESLRNCICYSWLLLLLLLLFDFNSLLWCATRWCVHYRS